MIEYVNVGMNFSFATQPKGGANELNITSRFVKHGLNLNRNSCNYLQQNNAQNSHHILMLS